MPNIIKSQRSAKRSAPLLRCPCGPDGLAFSAYWYRLPGIEGFFICSRCFEDNLSDTQFAGLFDRFRNDPLPGTKSVCDFNSRRTIQILVRAIRSCNIEPLLTFAEHRSTIAPCDGLNGTTGGRDIRWFTNPELPDFIACEACYEDLILATPFATKFTLHPHEHPVSETWICDLSLPYVRDHMAATIQGSDWYEFVRAVNLRSSVPVCDSKPVLLASRKWFVPVRPWPIMKMMICEACLLDHVSSLPAAVHFTRVYPRFAELHNRVLCSFKLGSIRSCNEHLLKDNYRQWHRLVDQITAKSGCTKGELEGEWYTLPDPQNTSRDITNFEICGACYRGYVEATGHANAFRRVKHLSSTTRLCDFSPVTPRSARYLQKWSQVVYTGDAGPLADYVSRLIRLAQCVRSTQVSKARWWGLDEFFFCAECYEDVAKGSYFAPLFTYQGTSFPEARCDMYSDNMRRRYLEACRKHALDEFLRYCRSREEIWQLMQQETKRQRMLLRTSERAYSQGMLLTTSSHSHSSGGSIYQELSTMVVSARPSLIKHRRVTAPARLDLEHRVMQGDLKRAQRRAVREATPKSPMLLHLESRWSEVE